MENIVETVISSVFSAACLIIAIMQLNNKGHLINNSYIWASKEERLKLDKKPYYRQSGIIFVMLTLVFALLALEAAFGIGWIIYLVFGALGITLVYSIASEVLIEKKKKENK